MPRSLSQNSINSLFAQETDEAYLVLLTIKDSSNVIARLSSDSVDTYKDRVVPPVNWDDTGNDSPDYWTSNDDNTFTFSRPGDSTGISYVVSGDVSPPLEDATSYTVKFILSNVVGTVQVRVWLGDGSTSFVSTNGSHELTVTSDFTGLKNIWIECATDLGAASFDLAFLSVDSIITETYYPSVNRWDDITDDPLDYWSHVGGGVLNFSRSVDQTDNADVKILDVSKDLLDGITYTINYTVSDLTGNFQTYVWLGDNHTSTVSANGTYNHTVTADYTNNSSLIVSSVGPNTGAASATVVVNYITWSVGGETFVSFPFDIVLPDTIDGQISKAKLVLDNVDRQLIEAVRTQVEPLRVNIKVVLSSNTSDIMAEFTDFTLRRVSYDNFSISGELTLEDFLNEPVGKIMTGKNFPGLFYI